MNTLMARLMGPRFSSPTAVDELLPIRGASLHYVSAALAEDGSEIMSVIAEQMRDAEHALGPRVRALKKPAVQAVELVGTIDRRGVRVAVRVPIEIVVCLDHVEARLVGEG